MLIDRYGRPITYLRVSVTDRCNYRCAYCTPPEVVPIRTPLVPLGDAALVHIVDTAVRLGMRKIRLTGGEPLLRPGIERLAAMIGALPGLEELCMTTNGSYLTPGRAAALQAAGLTRINISLDTLDEQEFSRRTRGGRLADVLRGIEAARAAGLTPVKINMVLEPQTPARAVRTMQEFCVRRGLTLQKIARFSLAHHPGCDLLAAHRPPACRRCSRLRLTCDGYLLPCLFSDRAVRVDPANVRESFLHAVAMKPQCGTACTVRSMGQVGG
jgi:cyclic pyranopterin phosphate synthase